MQSDTNPVILSFSGMWDQRLRSFLEPVEPAVDRIFGLEALRQAFLDARRAARHGRAQRSECLYAADRR